MLDTPELVGQAKQQLGELEDKSLSDLVHVKGYLPTLQVVVQLNQLAQGYLTPILGKKVVTRNQLDHELNIAVR